MTWGSMMFSGRASRIASFPVGCRIAHHCRCRCRPLLTWQHQPEAGDRPARLAHDQRDSIRAGFGIEGSGLLSSGTVARHDPLFRSHTFTVPSDEPETTRPSPVNANATTQPPCPDSVRSSWPLFRSHTFTVPSSEPETTRPSPVTANATDPTAMSRQRTLLLPAGQVPHLHRAIV